MPPLNFNTQTSHGSSHHRVISRILLLLLVFCCSGATCSRALRNPFAAVGPPAPEVLQPGATLEQVTEAVNQNTSRVLSYSTNNASITVPGMPSIPLLRGNIVAQRPHRFRLQASTALTGPEVDVGSGDQEFWFWVRRNEPPAVYFSRHDQFIGSAAQQAMPIQPQWLLEALGLVEFKPTDHHEGPLPHGNGTLEIRSIMQTPVGTLTKNTVIDARRAWVLQQHLYDSNGTLLASAVARSHRYYPEHGVSLPGQVDINLPSAQLAMSIDVGTLQINQLAENPEMWKKPSGYPQIDLGQQAVLDPNAVGIRAPAISHSGAASRMYRAPSVSLLPVTQKLPLSGVPAK